jgi:hypothetical protein
MEQTAIVFEIQRRSLAESSVLMTMPHSQATAATFNRWWLILSILVQLVLLTSPARAQSPVRILQEFDMFGTWADNCNAAPNPRNPFVIFQ